jgi:5-dehydro-4-deoxyglucarate dehydratase
MTPQEIKAVVGNGLAAFPVTDFSADGDFVPDRFADRLDWLAGQGAGTCFVAGGAGEFFSLTAGEYRAVIRCGVTACAGKAAVIAGAGGPTRHAIDCVREAERAGANGVLLMPHYMTEAGQQGLAAHAGAVCGATGLGVILYNRGLSVFAPETVARLAELHPNLIAVKDGQGDIEAMVEMRERIGDRLAFLCGMPTAEIYAAAYAAIGVPAYSSAVFNFVPQLALAFHRAHVCGDHATRERLLREFYLPFARLRRRVPGYAVSLVKSGVRLIGRSAGPVRPPLVDASAEDQQALAHLLHEARHHPRAD